MTINVKNISHGNRKEEESIQFFMACFVFQYFCFQIVQSGHTLCFYALQKLGSSTHYLSLLNETYTLLVSIFYSAAGISVSHKSPIFLSEVFSGTHASSAPPRLLLFWWLPLCIPLKYIVKTWFTPFVFTLFSFLPFCSTPSFCVFAPAH